jgi:hypothetical protein
VRDGTPDDNYEEDRAGHTGRLRSRGPSQRRAVPQPMRCSRHVAGDRAVHRLPRPLPIKRIQDGPAVIRPPCPEPALRTMTLALARQHTMASPTTPT